MKKFLKNRVSLIIPVALFLSTFFLYVHHISPSVFAGDSGDFLGAIAVRGVPHPSGYPLYVLLGIIASYLPTAQPLAWKVGLLSAFFSALSVCLMYLIVYRLLKNWFIALVISLTLAFTYPFWLYAEIVEVFALAYFFVLLLFYLTLLYLENKKIKILYLFSFCLGLALSNHEITFLLLPSLGLMILRANWKVFLSPKKLFICFFFFLLGLTPYLYIPIAASQNPPINWNDASNLKNFIHLVTRQDYGWGTTRSIPADYITGAFIAYSLYWKAQLSLFFIVMAIIGIFWLIRRNFFIFFIMLLSYFFFGPFVIVYASIPFLSVFQYGVFERFYVFSYLFFLFFFAYGLDGVLNIFSHLYRYMNMSRFGRRMLSSVLYCIFLLIPLLLLLQNYRKTDLHTLTLGEDFARDFLLSLPRNSYSLWNGDTLVFNSFYLHYAENIRKDVTLLSPRILKKTLENDQKMQKITKEIAQKHKLSDNNAILLAFILLQTDRPVMLNFINVFQQDTNDFISWMPHGITYKILPGKGRTVTKEEFAQTQVNIWKEFTIQDTIVQRDYEILPFHYLEIPYMYAQGAVNIGDYFIDQYREFDMAKKWYEKAVAYDPTISQVNKGLGSYYLHKKECRKAENHLQKYLYKNTHSSSAWLLLYVTYKDCLKDEKKAKNVEKLIAKLFKSEIRKNSNVKK